MPGEVLLDTNIVIGFFAGDPAIRSHLAGVDFYVPAVVLGELYAGALKSSRPAENLARIDAMIPVSAVLGCNAGTARLYGDIKHALLVKGRPIPDNDIWIAAVARQYALALATRDGHFAEVEDLALESW